MPSEPAAPVGDARHRIKVAALASFADKGFHATTTRDIASAAGMSPAAVYVHHVSKEALLHALSLEGHTNVLAVAQDAVAAGGSPTEQLRALVHAWVLTHAESHTVSRVINFELDALTPEHLGEVSALRRQITEVFQSVVAAGVASGEFVTEHQPMTVMALISLGVDVARWWRDDGSWSPQDLADHFTTLALRLVSPPRG